MVKLTEHLQTLEQFDLISPQPGETDLEYVFKHVFTQESVYQSLLRTDRRLVDALDGIYRGGEVYLRFFQRLSSLLFAIQSGDG